MKREFDIWKTIKLGTGPEIIDNFRCARQNREFNVGGGFPKDIFEQTIFTMDTEETEMDLVRVTVGGLGFRSSVGARRYKIYEYAEVFGFERCPPKLGLQLRIDYRDQPIDEIILIGMEPIIDSNGRPIVFSVERHNSELWLHGRPGAPNHVWHRRAIWIFYMPRK